MHIGSNHKRSFLLLMLLTCGMAMATETNFTGSVSAKKVVYFGHQSIGQNILNGIRNNFPAVVVEGIDAAKIQSNSKITIINSFIGRNGFPFEKMDDFANILRRPDIANTINIAAMKLCYVDFNKDTNIDAVFLRYKEMINTIENSNKNLVLVHFTVPLSVAPSGIKPFIKKLLGRPFTNNVYRNQYNELIRKEYGKTGRLFDLAMYEATSPDGTASSFKYEGKPMQSLYEGYASDEAHLNEKGQQVLSVRFLEFIDAIK